MWCYFPGGYFLQCIANDDNSLQYNLTNDLPGSKLTDPPSMLRLFALIANAMFLQGWQEYWDSTAEWWNVNCSINGAMRDDWWLLIDMMLLHAICLLLP